MRSIMWHFLPWFQPIFLHRTLTYMRSRQSPRNNARLGGFKIDSMLERKMKETHENLELMKPFMTLTFLGLYEKKSKYLLLQVRKALATFTGCAGYPALGCLWQNFFVISFFLFCMHLWIVLQNYYRKHFLPQRIKTSLNPVPPKKLRTLEIPKTTKKCHL